MSILCLIFSFGVRIFLYNVKIYYNYVNYFKDIGEVELVKIYY